MSLKLLTQAVGPWPMNTYVVLCPETSDSAIIDPGADANSILSLASGTNVVAVIVTHTHGDHIGALDEIKNYTGAPVYINPLETQHSRNLIDIEIMDGMAIRIGNFNAYAIHTPGHTPGMTSIDIGSNQIIVGDTIFVGGPGKTWSPKDFLTTMETMQNVVFKWSDETRFYPGHGNSGVIGTERPAFERFVARGWSKNLHGDVTWD